MDQQFNQSPDNLIVPTPAPGSGGPFVDPGQTASGIPIPAVKVKKKHPYRPLISGFVVLILSGLSFFVYQQLNNTPEIVFARAMAKLANDKSVSEQTTINVFNLPDEAKNKIIYYSGNPKKFLPSELFTKLTGQGLEFARVDSLSKNLSGSAMFVAGEVAGYYTDDPNVYDGLVSLHYAQTQNFKIYSGGPNGKLDFRNIKKRETGLYYPGYYLVLN